MKLTVKWPFNDIAMLPWDLSAFTFRMLPWDLSAFTFRMLPWDLAFPWDLVMFSWDLVMFPWDPFHPPGFHFSRGGVPVTTRPSGFSAREQKRKTSVTLYFTQWRTKSQFLLIALRSEVPSGRCWKWKKCQVLQQVRANGMSLWSSLFTAKSVASTLRCQGVQ